MFDTEYLKYLEKEYYTPKKGISGLRQTVQQPRPHGAFPWL